jgi:hypothetical protein
MNLSPYTLEICRSSACGPLGEVAWVRNVLTAPIRAARPRASQRRGSECAAPLRGVRCGARPWGRAEKLPPLAALAMVKQFRRVRARSALRAPTPRAVLLAAAYSPRHRPARGLAQPAVHRNRRPPPWCPQGRGWAAAGRACEATRSTGLAARARSALRALTRCTCLTTASAASGGSCATGPRARAPQCSRSEAKTASPKRPAAAQARPCLRGPSNTCWPTMKVGNGPQVALRATASRPLRVAHSATGH